MSRLTLCNNNNNFVRDFKTRTIRTAKVLGYTKLYSLITIKNIIKEYVNIEEELGVEKSTLFFSDILACVGRQHTFIFNLFLSKIETNRHLCGHRFFMNLFIGSFETPTNKNIKLATNVSDMFERMVSTTDSYDAASLDILNKEMKGYYRLMKHSMKETATFSAFSPNAVYSVDNDECVTVCINVMILLGNHKEDLKDPCDEEELKTNTLIELTNGSLYKNPLLDSVEDYIDNMVEMYLAGSMSSTETVMRNITKHIKSTVSCIINYDSKGESMKTLTRLVKTGINAIIDLLNNELFNEGEYDEDDLSDMGPILMEIENIIYNIVAALVTCNYMALSLPRKFKTKSSAIGEFKRLLRVSSYLSMLLGKDRTTDIFPTSDIEPLWEEMS